MSVIRVFLFLNKWRMLVLQLKKLVMCTQTQIKGLIDKNSKFNSKLR